MKINSLLIKQEDENITQPNLKMDDNDETENPVELPEKNWNRVINAATKAGYREGIEEGKQAVFQEGFDIGYEDAFETAFILGKYKALETFLANDHHRPSPVDDILEKTRRGACYICSRESRGSKVVVDDYTEPPIQEIRNEQKKHSKKDIDTLHKQFNKLLKDRGFSIDDLTF